MKFTFQNRAGLVGRNIYVSNLQRGFTETRLEDIDFCKTQPFHYFDYIWTIRKQQITVTISDYNHLAHVIVLWQIQKIKCYCTVFAFLFRI